MASQSQTSQSPQSPQSPQSLIGLKVAVLATDGFEQSELMERRKALDEAGAETEVISPKPADTRGWKMSNGATR